MAKYCQNCGAMILDESLSCPQCGAIQVQSNPAPAQQPVYAPVAPVQAPAQSVAPQPAQKPRKKAKWWMIAIPVVLVAALLVVFLWNPILMLISPKAALKQASDRTNQALALRGQEGPLYLLLNGVDPKGASTTDLKLTYAAPDYSSVYKDISFDLNVLSDPENHRYMASAGISAMGESLDATLYADGSSLAAGSSMFRDGQFFGIRFESFRSDLKNSPFGDQLTDEELDMLEEIMNSLQQALTTEIDYEALIKPYQDILNDFMAGLDAEKSSDDIRLDGDSVRCDVVSFRMDQDDIADLLILLLEHLQEDEQILELMKPSLSSLVAVDISADMEEIWKDAIDQAMDSIEEAMDMADLDLTISNYVRGGMVVAVVYEASIEVEGEEVELEITVNYGADPGTSDMYVELVMKADGEKMKLRLDSQIENDDDKYVHTIEFSASIPYEDSVSGKLITTWNKESGKLTLKFKGDDSLSQMNFELPLNLKKIDGGFKLSFEFEGDLNKLFDPSASYSEKCEITFEITCKQGAQIQTPSFVKIDQWDEDMLTDLEKAFASLGGAAPSPDYDDYY